MANPIGAEPLLLSAVIVDRHFSREAILRAPVLRLAHCVTNGSAAMLLRP